MPLVPGDLVLVPFPYTDLHGGKKRPALILSPFWYNEQSQDALMAYVTSVPQPKNDYFAMMINEDLLEAGRIVKPSWIRADKVFTLEQRLVIKSVAKLSTAQMEEVRSRLRVLLEDTAAPN